MALSTENKLYISLGVLVALGGLLALQSKKDKEEAQSYSVSGRAAELPKIDITEDDVKAIDKIQISKGAGPDGGVPMDIELVKKGEDWTLSKPLETTANQANVKSLLDNLKSLKVGEVIDGTKSQYDKLGVSDEKGLHAVISKAGANVLDVYFGESGGRGQMTRIAGKEGVYAVKGYSSYLYARDVKGWRDMTIFKFEDTQVASASIENENGSFSFTLNGDKWDAKFKKPKGKDEAIKDFDDSKVKDMLRAYKALNADNFAEKGKTAADVGLDKPTASVSITLKDGAKRELKLGATAEGTSRWALASGSDQIWSVSSWAADWATAEPKKFTKSEEKKPGPGSGDAEHPNAMHLTGGGMPHGHP